MFELHRQQEFQGTIGKKVKQKGINFTLEIQNMLVRKLAHRGLYLY